MKLRCLALIALIVSAFGLQAGGYDEKIDQQILKCMHSSEFCNVVITYPFSGFEYPIRVIHNPKKEMLDGNYLSPSQQKSLIMVSNLPYQLATHLERLISHSSYRESSYVEFRGYDALHTFDSIHPVYLADQVDDPASDELVKKTFSSSEFVNQVLYYRLEGTCYKVRLLYNPEWRSFSATKHFALFPSTTPTPYSISWKNKYAIIVDQTAPSELIDHLSSLSNASYWDWYFNFDVDNGTYVVHKEIDSSSPNITYTTTYNLDSWFNYTENFR